MARPRATTTTAGYSGTPLWKKLGIIAGSRVFVVHAPADYRAWLTPLPDDVTFQRGLSRDTDVVHLFTTRAAELMAETSRWRHQMRPDAAIWVSWPKKASQVPTDITEDRIRDIVLPMGLVDVKVCAVSEVWSGLKLMIRRELRRA
ncbi:MAG: DUF3052 domain-containing protein [Acidobacteria bacterium]|nr:DUF3052 domain-containing protein [Acidobacteriota bacterium]